MASTETFRMAGQVIRRSPGRSTLTVLGLAIGVAAFIAMVSFGEGARRSVLSQFQALGTHIVKVRTRINTNYVGRKPLLPLTDRDVAALRRESTSILDVVPIASNGIDVSYAGKEHWTNLNGTTPPFPRLREWTFTEGGMFDEEDVGHRAKVCVLGATIVRELFGHVDPLGEAVTIGGRFPCRVVGVLSEKGASTAGNDLDDVVLMPVTTFNIYFGDPTGYPSIEIRPLGPDLLEAAKAEATEILRRSHKLEPNDAEDFKVTSPVEVIRAADKTSQILTGLLAGIAAVSLLVGGIGVMNIQLVSVAERTTEIGIRAAIGASPSQILTQFLAEALALSAIGSLAGAVLGVSAAAIVANAMHWPRVISAVGVSGSVLFGMIVGILFGYLPAQRAARLDPIQALRHE